jgi:polysaccharide deacetylase family protein (PEP-CTERM system associated)
MGQRESRTGMAITRTSVTNVMTIDVEDYFQVSAFESAVPKEHWDRFESRVVGNTERVLAILGETGVRATFFVLGWTAERYPELVEKIIAEGHEIASHGYAHRLVYDMTPEQFREDLRRGKDALLAAGAEAVHGYRAPSYSITERSLWAFDVLLEEGFAWDASVFPIRHDRYGIPTAPRHPYWVERNGGRLLEIPGSTVRLGGINLPIGGGGYFRLLPYAWTSRGIRRVNEVECRPAVFYLHPWEIDPGQPRLAGSALSRFRHYRNLAQTESRLRRLLSDFSFARMSDVLAPDPVRRSPGSTGEAADV